MCKGSFINNKLTKASIVLSLLISFFNRPVYAWMCTGQDNYPLFDICGDLFGPTILLAGTFFILGLIFLIISAVFSYLKKDKVKAKLYLKLGIAALILATILLFVVFPPRILLNIISVTEKTL